jgi:hypothetical protein
MLETLTSSKEVIIHSYNLYLIQTHLSFVFCSNSNLVKCTMTFNLMYHWAVWCSAESHILMKESNDSFEWFSSSHSSSHRTEVHLLTSVWTKQTLQQMSYWLVWTACSKVLLMFCNTSSFSLIMLYRESQSTFNFFSSISFSSIHDLCLFLRKTTSQSLYDQTHLKLMIMIKEYSSWVCLLLWD